MRGDELRDHILWAAKDVLLEVGFERASMDEIASRAATSKRTLYAHFESKEKLYLAVIDLVRGLFTGRLKMPGDYVGTPAEVLTAFCGRYLEILLYEKTIQMCRVSIAEAARFPEGTAQYFDLIFTSVQDQLAAYLKTAFGLSAKMSAEAAQRLLAQVAYPKYQRALFGLDPLVRAFDEKTLNPKIDLQAIRSAVAEMIGSLPKR